MTVNFACVSIITSLFPFKGTMACFFTSFINPLNPKSDYRTVWRRCILMLGCKGLSPVTPHSNPSHHCYNIQLTVGAFFFFNLTLTYRSLPKQNTCTLLLVLSRCIYIHGRTFCHSIPRNRPHHCWGMQNPLLQLIADPLLDDDPSGSLCNIQRYDK